MYDVTGNVVDDREISYRYRVPTISVVLLNVTAIAVSVINVETIGSNKIITRFYFRAVNFTRKFRTPIRERARVVRLA